jgi:hypothetical protein
MLVITSLGTQMGWFQTRSVFTFPTLCATTLPLVFFLMMYVFVDGVFWYTKHVHYTFVWI